MFHCYHLYLMNLNFQMFHLNLKNLMYLTNR